MRDYQRKVFVSFIKKKSASVGLRSVLRLKKIADFITIAQHKNQKRAVIPPSLLLIDTIDPLMRLLRRLLHTRHPHGKFDIPLVRFLLLAL